MVAFQECEYITLHCFSKYLIIIVYFLYRFFKLSISDTFSLLSDDELEMLIKPMVVENPHLGYRSIQARLRTMLHNLNLFNINMHVVLINI